MRFSSLYFIEQEQGWTNNNDTLDASLFYQDDLDLIQNGNFEVSESITKATEDANIGQNEHFNEMANKKHN